MYVLGIIGVPVFFIVIVLAIKWQDFMKHDGPAVILEILKIVGILAMFFGAATLMASSSEIASGLGLHPENLMSGIIAGLGIVLIMVTIWLVFRDN